MVAAAVLEARHQPSTYGSRRPGRQVPTIVDQVVSFTFATDDVMVTVPSPLAWWRRFGVVPDEAHRMRSPVLEVPDRYRCLVDAPPDRPLISREIV
jgi:hypothetical protein